MKIFVDENIPAMTVDFLRSMGHDVMDIRGTEKEGLNDYGIWEIVQKEKRLLITTDKGFAIRRDVKHNGILIVRLRQPNRKRIHSRVMQVLFEFKESEWNGLLVTVRDTVQSIWRSEEK
jgi:predicted nuclease of predicted toxin-antitoxin system